MLRAELDEVDRTLVAAFEKRMALSQEVARCKLRRGLPVLDQSREAQVLASRAAMAQDAHWAESVRALYREIMRLSRAEQERMLREARDEA